MSEILRVALLGGGKMALQHAAAIRQCPDARLVAVVDPHVAMEELKAKFGAGVAAFPDAQSMLAEIRPDVVHVVTPPASHAALARQCLEAGAHVYVEKPFALTTADAESVLRLAESRGLKVCAAHQVLFQGAGRGYGKHLPMIGKIIHVESFFSFKPVRRRTAGGPSTPVDQLIDILPHPVYLLLDALPAEGGARAEITGLDVSIDGEVRAVVRKGDALAVLVVSLRARPVESWLRVMGTNGMVEADFVLGNVIRHPGPGASAVSVVLKPFSRAWQIGWGSLKTILKLIFRGHKSYPGLTELLQAFYAATHRDGVAPIKRQQIVDTVSICESIAAELSNRLLLANERALTQLRLQETVLPPLSGRGIALVTGGTGMLGRPTAALLRDHGWKVRVPVRRTVPPQEMLPGIEYVSADLSGTVPDELLDGVHIVVHLAAETSGAKSEHERNTIVATRNLIDACRRQRVRHFINVSSVAVLKPARLGRRLREDSPVDHGNPGRGPYVWAKAEAERMACEAGSRNGLAVKTIRLGPLVDYEHFTAPGRLGREVGRLFVAPGLPFGEISVCGLSTAASIIVEYAEHFESAPPIVNLLEAPAERRGQLTARLKQSRPDLVVVWLPLSLVAILSAVLTVLQKIARPRSPALSIYSAFKSERFDLQVATNLSSRMHQRRVGISP